MSSPDNNWLPLMLLLTYMAMQNSDGQIESIRINDPYEKLKSLQESCPTIEWEQDMNARVPFCMIDGQLCNGQCRK